MILMAIIGDFAENYMYFTNNLIRIECHYYKR